MNQSEVLDTWKLHSTESHNNWCYCPLERVQERLFSTGYARNKLHFVKGNVISALPPKIAILRLDTDWYESSRYELEQLYDRVVDGGIIIFDSLERSTKGHG